MFHHDKHAFAAETAGQSTNAIWYVDDTAYQRALRDGMRLRSEIALRLAKTAGRRIAGLFAALIAEPAAPAETDEAGIQRLADGSIDHDHYDRRARQARAEVAGRALDALGRGLGSRPTARTLRGRILAGADTVS